MKARKRKWLWILVPVAALMTLLLLLGGLAIPTDWWFPHVGNDSSSFRVFDTPIEEQHGPTENAIVNSYCFVDYEPWDTPYFELTAQAEIQTETHPDQPAEPVTLPPAQRALLLKSAMRNYLFSPWKNPVPYLKRFAQADHPDLSPEEIDQIVAEQFVTKTLEKTSNWLTSKLIDGTFHAADEELRADIQRYHDETDGLDPDDGETPYTVRLARARLTDAYVRYLYRKEGYSPTVESKKVKPYK